MDAPDETQHTKRQTDVYLFYVSSMEFGTIGLCLQQVNYHCMTFFEDSKQYLGVLISTRCTYWKQWRFFWRGTGFI